MRPTTSAYPIFFFRADIVAKDTAEFELGCQVFLGDIDPRAYTSLVEKNSDAIWCESSCLYTCASCGEGVMKVCRSAFELGVNVRRSTLVFTLVRPGLRQLLIGLVECFSTMRNVEALHREFKLHYEKCDASFLTLTYIRFPTPCIVDNQSSNSIKTEVTT